MGGSSRKRMMRLLLEYLKDSKRTDRELANILGVSQPTVTRMRSRLLEEGFIREFTVTPDFVKLGYEIMAFVFFRSKRGEGVTGRALEWTMSKPNVIFASAAEGMGKNAVLISFHRDYTDYFRFMEEILVLGKDIIQDLDTSLISLKGNIVKPFSLKYLGEQQEK